MGCGNGVVFGCLQVSVLVSSSLHHHAMLAKTTDHSSLGVLVKHTVCLCACAGIKETVCVYSRVAAAKPLCSTACRWFLCCKTKAHKESLPTEPPRRPSAVLQKTTACRLSD